MTYDAMKTNISTNLFGLKTEMGGLAELVDNWILTLKGEEERRSRVRAISDIMSKSGMAFPPDDRAEVLSHLEALLSPSEFMMFSSVGYREKLQLLFRTQLEKVNSQLDQLILLVQKLLERLESPLDPHERTVGIFFAQEEERKRISREIHDGPAQTLAALTMRIDYTLELLLKPDELKVELNELKSSIIRSLNDIRRFIFDLRPMALDDLGLIPTLEQFITGCKGRTVASLSLTVEGKRQPLPADKELATFRVIQEAVNNSIRHSQARAISIFLTFEVQRGFLSIVVKDDGKGFDLEKLRKVYSSLKKLGLVSMEERIRTIGGLFEIVSASGDGTVISFKVPL